MIRDYNIEWLKKRIYVPAYSFSTYAIPNHAHSLLITGGQAAGDALQVLSAVVGKTAAGDVTASGGTQNILNSTLALSGVGTSGASLAQVPALPLVGALMSASAGQQARHYLMLPYDINRRRQIEFYLYLTKSSSVTALTPRLRYGLFNSGTALADVSTALSIPFSEISNATNYTLIRSGAGMISANVLSSANLFMGLRIDIAAQTGADDIYLLGVEMVYTPRKTAGVSERGGVDLRSGEYL